MTIKTRYTKVDEWKQASNELVQYYFDTTDINEIKARFGNKRVIKVMNLYFTITRN